MIKAKLRTHCSVLNGFTLIELLVVVGILMVLAILAIPNTSAVIDRAQGVLCASKLRNLWLNFSTVLTDETGWPQLPRGIDPGSMQEQRWWLDYSVNNLGMKASDWMCPSVGRRISSVANRDAVPLISYYPTLFDANPATPRSWPRMPWFTEMASIHGKPNLSVRSDGSVCPVRDP